MSSRSLKPTGLSTVATIPGSWHLLRNSALFVERREKNHPDLEMHSVTQARGVVAQSSLDSRVTAPSDDRTGYNRIAKGDLVYNKMRMWQGAVGVAPAEGIVSTAYVVMAPRPGVNSRYFEYLYRTPAFIAESGRFSYGLCDDMNSLRADSFKAMMSPVPPEGDQDLIVRYLDSETARIDSLIDRKERFIELLLEKRTALITHAVTKGLDPNVKMKDSGVEWIGSLPVHWDAARIKQVCRLESGHTPSRQRPEYWVDCTVPWITTSEVWQVRDGRAEYIAGTKEKVSELGLANSSARKLPPGTVVVSRTASVGFSAIMPVEMATSQDFANWVPGPLVASEYLLYAFRSMRQEFDRLMMGSTHQTIYMHDIQKFSMPLPPIDEQKRIITHIRSATSLNDDLVDKTRMSIDLLREYRTALISAAVTGQIEIPATDPGEDVA